MFKLLALEPHIAHVGPVAQSKETVLHFTDVRSVSHRAGGFQQWVSARGVFSFAASIASGTKWLHFSTHCLDLQKGCQRNSCRASSHCLYHTCCLQMHEVCSIVTLALACVPSPTSK